MKTGAVRRISVNTLLRKSLFLFLLAISNEASGADSPAEVIGRVEEHFGLPRRSLAAICLAESGDQALALNYHGTSIFPRDKRDALRYLSLSDEFDIGLCQVNWPTWKSAIIGAGFGKEDLLDSRVNALLTGKILRDLLDKYPLWEAIGRYHSPTSAKQREYAWQVYQKARARGAR